MEEVKKKLDLLLLPSWGYKDIMAFTGFGSTKAIQIKEKARIKFNGKLPYGGTKVSIDSVLAIFGTSREKEIQLLLKVIKEDVGNGYGTV